MQLLEDGSWGQYHGHHCDALRAALCEFHQTEHAILCSSGTSAVELALRSVPVTAGDEVILSAYDFKSNFVNVLTTGCLPVLIDTDKDFPVPDLNQLEVAITGRTRAIIVSHLHGNLVPMRTLCQLAERYGIAVIEDACQVTGAIVEGRRAGAWGDIGILSFGGSKLLTAGRGGAVLTSNTRMAQRIRLYTQRGNDAYPLSEMQSAVLLPQLRQLDDRNALRTKRLQMLVESTGVSRLQPAFALKGLSSSETSTAAFYKAAFAAPFDWTEQQRKRFCEKARSFGVPIDPGFSGLHRIHSRQRFRSIGQLPNTDRWHSQLMTLHHTALLGAAESIPIIAEILNVNMV